MCGAAADRGRDSACRDHVTIAVREVFLRLEMRRRREVHPPEQLALHHIVPRIHGLLPKPGEVARVIILAIGRGDHCRRRQPQLLRPAAIAVYWLARGESFCEEE